MAKSPFTPEERAQLAKERAQRWYQKNKEKVLERQKAYNKEQRDKKREEAGKPKRANVKAMTEEQRKEHYRARYKRYAEKKRGGAPARVKLTEEEKRLKRNAYAREKARLKRELAGTAEERRVRDRDADAEKRREYHRAYMERKRREAGIPKRNPKPTPEQRRERGRLNAAARRARARAAKEA
jgi:hypothetical protein